MKKKFLSVAMAVVMVVVCLTGCSGNFSKSSFISAAKSSGLKEVEETTELNHMYADPGEHIALFYDVEDIHIFEYVGDPLSNYVSINEVEEFVLAVDSEGETDKHIRCFTRIYFLTLKDSDTAEELYKSVKRGIMKPKEGKKNGVAYTISYQGPDNSLYAGSTNELAVGLYLMGNHVVWIRSDHDTTVKNKTVEKFCKSLGIVSPYTLS